MSWNGELTTAGEALLQSWTTGGNLNITHAVGLSDGSQKAVITPASSTLIPSGNDKGVRLQLVFESAETQYTLDQIDIHANLSGGADTILVTYTDSTGQLIPSDTDSPAFRYQLWCNILLDKTTDITITGPNSDVFALVGSPQFTGVPTAPTASTGTNTTQIATTAFVNATVNEAIPTYITISGTSGTLTENQLAILQASKNNYIVSGSYVYRLVSGDSTTLYYQRIAATTNKNQYFTITVSNRNFSYTDTALSTTDTKNTAGSTNLTSKLYLVGAGSQADNPQTYSNVNVYEQNGVVYANQFTIANTPSSDSDAATKKYVDDSIAGIPGVLVFDMTSISSIAADLFTACTAQSSDFKPVFLFNPTLKSLYAYQFFDDSYDTDEVSLLFVNFSKEVITKLNIIYDSTSHSYIDYDQTGLYMYDYSAGTMKINYAN